MSHKSRSVEEKNLLWEKGSTDDVDCSQPIHEENVYFTTRKERSYKWLFAHLILMGLYTAIFFYMTYSIKTKDGFGDVPETYSPATGEIKYYIKEPMLDHSAHTPFYGEPRLEMDQAWYEVFKGTIITVTPEELRKANLTSFKLAGSENYGASLGVYHDLHCLKRIKQWMYPDYYYKDITPQEKADSYEHLQHCFEVLRESLMCRPDISLLGYDSNYISSRGTPKTLTASQRCADWDALHAWSLNRAPADPANAYLHSKSRPENQKHDE